MGIYITYGNWANGCGYRVVPDGDSVLPRDGEAEARRLFALPEEPFWEKILENVQRGWMTHEKADKVVEVYFKKRTHNAYEEEGA